MSQPKSDNGTGPIKRLYRKLFGRSRWKQFNRRLQYYGQIGLGIGYTTLEQSGEAETLPRIMRQMPAEPLIFDVGANRGDYAVLMRKNRADAKIIAFEPNLVPMPDLERQAQAHHFDVVKSACGDKDGSAVLYDRNQSRRGAYATLSTAVGEALLGDNPSQTDVNVITLDSYAAENNIDHIQHVKIDTEGWEIPVLKGAERLIREQRICWLSFEFCHHHVHTRTFMKDFYDILPGWTFYRILPHGLLPLGVYEPQHWEIFDWQNIFATAPGHDIDLNDW